MILLLYVAGNKILDMAFCSSDNWIACQGSNDSISLINIETGDQSITQFNVRDTHLADTDSYGHIVALATTEYGELLLEVYTAHCYRPTHSATPSSWQSSLETGCASHNWVVVFKFVSELENLRLAVFELETCGGCISI